MRICKALPDDIDKVKDIWQICFNDKHEFIDFFFSSRYNSDNTICAWEGDSIVSCLQLLPYTLLLRGKIVDASYIVGVSTLPDHRSKGYARQLLHYALDQMNSDRIPVSILLPFNYGFYNRYGWAICYEHLKITNISNYSLHINTNIMGSFKEIDPESDSSILDYCYKTFMKEYNGYISRSREDWLRLFSDCTIDNGTGYICLDKGKPLGYFLYIIDDNRLLIREMAYISIRAKEAILAFAMDLNKQLCLTAASDSINWNAPADDLTYLKMPDSRGHLLKEAYVMGRINNVINALDGITAESDNFNIHMKVEDPFYKENDSTYLLTSEDGLISLAKSNKPFDINLAVNTLSQILWGYITPVQAYKNGLMETNSPDLIEKLGHIFPKTIPYIVEDY